MRIGFYPGSFDPITFGHLDIVARSARVVDKLVVGIGTHSGKHALLKEEERVNLVEQVARPVAEHSHLKLEVVTFSGLAVEAARKAKACLIIRGLRDATDFDYEVQMGQMNAALDPRIDTVFLAASPATRMIASSLVKQIARMGGDISAFVPGDVIQSLDRAIKNAS